jgi:hypothetical protein
MPARRILALIACLAVSPLANALNYDVSSLADSGTGTLREAVGFANGTPNVPDTITFSVTGTITLTSGELVVTDTLSITGPGARKLTIDGNLNDRLFEVQTNTTNLSLSGLTLTRGLTNGNGGAILNNGGNLTLSFVRITGNQSGAEGGAIYDSFQADVGGNSVNFLTISNSEISINRANKNAGIFHSGFELRIDNSTIHNNIAGDSVGGILEQGGFATIRNSTISGNNAAVAVGGFQSQDSTVTFESVLFADNTDPSGPNDINRIGGGTVGATNSLFEEDISLAPAVLNGANSGNLIAVESQLPGALSNNGGPTNSARPPSTSPAIGVGSNSQSYSFDQRGTGFARDAGGAVDIGAIQSFVEPRLVQLAKPVPGLGALPLALLSLLVGLAGLARRRRR